jgi:hypothetical protein
MEDFTIMNMKFNQNFVYKVGGMISIDKVRSVLKVTNVYKGKQFIAFLKKILQKEIKTEYVNKRTYLIDYTSIKQSEEHNEQKDDTMNTIDNEEISDSVSQMKSYVGSPKRLQHSYDNQSVTSRQTSLLSIDEVESIFTNLINKREKENHFVQTEKNQFTELQFQNKRLLDETTDCSYRLTSVNDENKLLKEQLTNYQQRVALLEYDNKQLHERLTKTKNYKQICTTLKNDKSAIKISYNALRDQFTSFQNLNLSETIKYRLSQTRTAGVKIVDNPHIFYTTSAKERKKYYSDYPVN